MTGRVETFEERRERTLRSRECKTGDHAPACSGFYDTSGSTVGYATYVCHCRCHHEAWREAWR